jgi:hypothetical protein
VIDCDKLEKGLRDILPSRHSRARVKVDIDPDRDGYRIRVVAWRPSRAAPLRVGRDFISSDDLDRANWRNEFKPILDAFYRCLLQLDWLTNPTPPVVDHDRGDEQH